MKLARGGDVSTAARCELALRGIAHPTAEQTAGATLGALQAEDLRRLCEAYVKDG